MIDYLLKNIFDNYNNWKFLFSVFLNLCMFFVYFVIDYFFQLDCCLLRGYFYFYNGFKILMIKIIVCCDWL